MKEVSTEEITITKAKCPVCGYDCEIDDRGNKKLCKHFSQSYEYCFEFDDDNPSD